MKISLYYLSIGITIFANVLYHIFQKNVSSNAHPIVSLIVTYVVSLCLCFALLPFFPVKGGLVKGFQEINWASYALAIALIGLEIGFLLVYRAGWNISIASIYSNVLLALILVPIGYMFYQEGLSSTKLVGIIICIIGIFLISK